MSGEECVICHASVTTWDSGLCNTHKYDEQFETAANRLFHHNMALYALDREQAEFEWVTDPDLRKFWIEQIRVAFGVDDEGE